MSTVSTLSTNNNTYTYDEFEQLVNSGALSTASLDNVSIFKASTDESQCTDGSDDGKIGFGSALFNIGKGVVSGVVKGIKGMFSDSEGNFSIGSTLKTAATVGACFLPGVGPVIAAGLCTVGVVKGATGLASGVASAVTADTDAEAKVAYQSIGTSGLTLGLSATGLKASTTAVAQQAGFSSVGEVAKSFSKNGGATVKQLGSGVTNYYSSAWAGTSGSNASRVGQVAEQTLKDTGINMVAAAKAAKEKVAKATDKITGKTKTGTKSTATSEATGTNTKHISYSKDADGKTIKTTKVDANNISVKEANKLGKMGYELDTDTMTLTKTTTGRLADASKLMSDVNTAVSEVGAGEYATYTSKATGKTTSTVAKNQPAAAALTTYAGSVSDEADEAKKQISNASTTYVATSSTSGVEYTLEDYSLPTSDELDETFLKINNQLIY